MHNFTALEFATWIIIELKKTYKLDITKDEILHDRLALSSVGRITEELLDDTWSEMLECLPPGIALACGAKPSTTEGYAEWFFQTSLINIHTPTQRHNAEDISDFVDFTSLYHELLELYFYLLGPHGDYGVNKEAILNSKDALQNLYQNLAIDLQSELKQNKSPRKPKGLLFLLGQHLSNLRNKIDGDESKSDESKVGSYEDRLRTKYQSQGLPDDAVRALSDVHNHILYGHFLSRFGADEQAEAISLLCGHLAQESAAIDSNRMLQLMRLVINNEPWKAEKI